MHLNHRTTVQQPKTFCKARPTLQINVVPSHDATDRSNSLFCHRSVIQHESRADVHVIPREFIPDCIGGKTYLMQC